MQVTDQPVTQRDTYFERSRGNRSLNTRVIRVAPVFLIKFLIRDPDAEFTAAFDAVFTAVGARIIKTAVRAPRANAIAERWIASARRECLDRILVTSKRHLRLVVSEYVDHYDVHRPHRTFCQSPPAGRERPPTPGATVRVLRRNRLGGLIHGYAQDA